MPTLSDETAGIRRVRNLDYAAPDGHKLGLDLYLPTTGDGSPIPTVIYLHGGGFLVGKRDDLPDRLFGLAAQGIAVASASYRLASVAPYPAQLHDVHAAIHWLQLHGAEYGLSTEKIGLWGASAGAILSLLTAFSPEGEVDGQAKGSIAAVVSWFVASDLSDEGMSTPVRAGATPPPEVLETIARDGVALPFDPPMTAQLLGVSAEEARERTAEISPLSFAKRPGPPVLLMHGTADGLAAVEHSIWFYDAMRAAGGDARLLLVEGANHEDPAFARSDVLGAVAAFLREQLA